MRSALDPKPMYAGSPSSNAHNCSLARHASSHFGYNVPLNATNRISHPSRASSAGDSVQPHLGDDGRSVPTASNPMSPTASGTPLGPGPPLPHGTRLAHGQGWEGHPGSAVAVSPDEVESRQPPEERDARSGPVLKTLVFFKAKHTKSASQDASAARLERGGVSSARASRSDHRTSRITKHRTPRPRRSQPDPASPGQAVVKVPTPPDTGNLRATVPRSSTNNPVDDTATEQVDDVIPTVLLQPETRPISHSQLVVEVRGIYAGLVMVEAKCIDVDEKQLIAAQDPNTSRSTKLSSEQWRALIALHKTLLHEHHDFFLASQHPAATPMLSGLANKYAMAARLWRHGIYGFLEVLRYRLPDSLDHMLAFIYIAYSMIALLYETALGFESTWIEALGDLSRYRMAIETEDMEIRQTWSNVSRSWYIKATDKDPSVCISYLTSTTD